MMVEKLLAALKARDCEPRQVGPGLWVAARATMASAPDRFVRASSMLRCCNWPGPTR